MNKIQCVICKKLTKPDLLFCKSCGSLPKGTKVHTGIAYNILYYLQEIQTKIHELGEKLGKPYTTWVQFFASLEIKIMIASFSLETPDEQKKAFENYLIKKYIDQPKSKIDTTLKQFLMDKQLSFLLGWLIIFEDTFYYIVRDILKKTPSRYYKDNVETIVDTIMSNEDKSVKKKYIDSLYFPYAVRNTLHRMGISDNDAHAKINGFNFYMKKEKYCTVVTWVHLIFYAESMIDTFTILFDQPIFDKYKKN